MIPRDHRRITRRTAAALEAWLLGATLALCALVAAGVGPARLFGALALVTLVACVAVEWNAEP